MINCPLKEEKKCNWVGEENDLQAHMDRSHKKKLFTKATERYEVGEVPSFDKQPLAEIVEKNGLSYPACKKHGALNAYKDGIYRCEICGWAIRYYRRTD